MGAAGVVGAQTARTAAALGGEGVPVTASLADPTPGLRYLLVTMFDFDPFSAAAERVISSPGAYSSVSSRYSGPIRLPTGSRIKEITLAVKVTTAAAASQLSPGLEVVIVDQGRFNAGLALSYSSSPDIQTKTADVDHLVTHGRQYYVTIDLRAGSEAQIVGALIGYEPAAEQRALLPIEPTRVYDSRQPQPFFGPLAAGQNRTVSVADGRNVNGGAITEPDIVPEGATAITYNLTVSGTVGAGFLAIAPGDATTFKASAINWASSGLVLANAGLVKLDDNRQIKVFCGTGSTDFIIDTTGYLL
jgi:hypothetical protein